MKKDLYDKSVRTAHFVLCGRPGYMRDGEDGFECEDHVFTVYERSLDNDEPTERDLQEFIDEVKPDEEDMASFLADCECWDYGDEWATLEVNCELRFEDAQDVALAFMRALEEYRDKPKATVHYNPGYSRCSY